MDQKNRQNGDFELCKVYARAMLGTEKVGKTR